MAEIEQRQYVISGEISPADWQLSIQLLGKLGVDAARLTAPITENEPAPVVNEELEPGSIPYRLNEISSPDQYLANEHLGEYWPEYKTVTEKPGNKHNALCWGLNLLAYPSPKKIGYRLSTKQHIQYAESLGIQSVRPRSSVGFSDEYKYGCYGLWNYRSEVVSVKGDAVIRVGSFIQSVRGIDNLSVKDRPNGIDSAVLRFFLALATKLEGQLNDVDAETPVV